MAASLNDVYAGHIERVTLWEPATANHALQAAHVTRKRKSWPWDALRRRLGSGPRAAAPGGEVHSEAAARLQKLLLNEEEGDFGGGEEAWYPGTRAFAVIVCRTEAMARILCTRRDDDKLPQVPQAPQQSS